MKPELADTGRAGGVKDWSLVGSGGGVGSEGEGVEEGSLFILEVWRWVCWPPSLEPDPEYPG